MRDSKLYTKIRDLRTQRGWTQEKLAEMLVVNPQAVKAWESPTKRALPKLDKLLAMCELFDCDLDHLTGRLEESTHDIHFVHEYTGLSEEAIKKTSSLMAEVLSHMIETDNFEKLIDSYGIFLDLLHQLDVDDVSQLSAFELQQKGNVVLSTNEAINHFKQKVTLAMEHICDTDHMTRLSQLEYKKDITDLDSLKREIRSTKGEIAYLTEHLEFLEGEVLPEIQNRKKRE